MTLHINFVQCYLGANLQIQLKGSAPIQKMKHASDSHEFRAHLWEVVAEELIDMLIIEGLSFIQQYSIHIVNKRDAVTQHLHVVLVHMLQCVDFIPEFKYYNLINFESLVQYNIVIMPGISLFLSLYNILYFNYIQGCQWEVIKKQNYILR